MNDYTQDHRIGCLTTALGKDVLLLLGLTAQERLSESYIVTIDAWSAEPATVHDLLGTAIGVAFTGGAEGIDRDFAGMLWEYSELGRHGTGWRYQLVLRPDTQLLTLNKRNRIFQNKSVVDIVTAILPGPYRADLNGSYAAMDYCVQYQESDFAFVSRLMEYEGIYYYYEHAGDTATMVLVDDANAHKDLTPATVRVSAGGHVRDDAPIVSLVARRGLAPARVTVADYDFEAPSRQLQATQAAEGMGGSGSGAAGGEGRGDGNGGGAEIYDFPAKYTGATSAKGAHYGAVWLDAHRRRMARSFAEGRLFAGMAGRRVTLEEAGGGAGAGYLIVGTQHRYAAPAYRSAAGQDEEFSCALELMPAATQYRPALVTPRPRIPGPQTAIVVGPAGEEIHTDRHGRIKVQFFWDREGRKDDTAGCFIRVMQAGAGQGWGSFALPRIGQEVVVSFLDGDPDRPLVTGAVYNATNTPPEALPENKTQFGLKTRITQSGGGGGGFNRLWFEDRKGAEVVWFRAERDYKVNIVNQDEERVYDKGSRTTTFKEGDTTLTVTKGTRTATIEGDDTTTIKAGNVACTIEKGDETHAVKLGKRTTEVFGNETLEVKTGNVSIKVTAGKHATQAMQAIELTCGASKVKMDPASITIESAMVTIDAKAVLKLKAGAMITTDGGGMHMMKAGLVMIN